MTANHLMRQNMDMKFSIPIVLCALLFLYSCGKEKQSDEVIYIHDNVIKTYKMKLSNDTIMEYAVYLDDYMTSTTKYHFYVDSVIVITTNANGVTTNKNIYYLDNTGNATLSLDSLYDGDGVNYHSSSCTYSYENGYLVERIVNSTGIFRYNVNNGNLDKMTVGNHTCGIIYSYNTQQNLIDVMNFSNHLFGRPNNNLLLKQSYSGCPCGPSSTDGYTNYIYYMNGDGTVQSMEVVRTACHHTSDPTRIYISMKRYEYDYL